MPFNKTAQLPQGLFYWVMRVSNHEDSHNYLAVIILSTVSIFPEIIINLL
jgi:hypothetical protein